MSQEYSKLCQAVCYWGSFNGKGMLFERKFLSLTLLYTTQTPIYRIYCKQTKLCTCVLNKSAMGNMKNCVRADKKNEGIF